MEKDIMELSMQVRIITLSICAVAFVFVVFMDKVADWLKSGTRLLFKLFGAGKK